MARLIAFWLLIWQIGLSLQGQPLLRGTVMNAQSGSPVAYARIFFANQPAKGTISNEEGAFVIEAGKERDTLVVSHMNFVVTSVAVTPGVPTKVALPPKERVLAAVPLYGLSGTQLMREVIEALPTNHQVEPVVYQAYIRTILYEANHSALHLTGDYVFFYTQEKTAGPALAATLAQLSPQKGRIRTYSPLGREDSINGFGMQKAAGFIADNLFNARYPIFKKKKLKHYRIDLVGEVKVANRTFLKIELEPLKEDESSYTLFVEEKTKAVGKMIEQSPGGRYHEVSFEELAGQWYLAYSLDRSNLNSPSVPARERIVIYHLVSEPPDELAYFPAIRVYGLRFEDLENFLTKWEDPFWDEFPSLPLADWMNQVLAQEQQK